MSQLEEQRLKAKTDEDYWVGRVAGAQGGVLDIGGTSAPDTTAFTVHWTEELEAATGRDPLAFFAAATVAFAIALHRHLEQAELMIAFPAIRDDRPGTFGMLNFRIDRGMTAKAVFEQGLASLNDGLRHGGIDLEVLAGRLEALGDADLRMPGVGVQLAELADCGRPASCILWLEIDWAETQKMTARLHHPADVFGTDARCLVETFKSALEEIRTWAGRPVGDIPLIPGPLVADHASVANGPDPYKCGGLLAGIASSAAMRPGATAVIAEDGALSYSELAGWSDRLATRLREVHRVDSETVVAVMLGRTRFWPLAALAIWKAGAVYMPLEPDTPSGRLDDIRGEAKPEVLLTDASSIPFGLQADLAIELLDAGMADWPVSEWSDTPAGTDGCYLLFTSGTTDTPKGVLVERSAFENLSSWVAATHLATDGEPPVCVMTASCMFDASVQLLAAPFLAGGTLVISSDDERRDPARHVALLERVGAEVIDITPLFLSMVLDAARKSGSEIRLRSILVGGDVLSGSVAERVGQQWPATALWNVYGATEAGCDSVAERVRSDGAPVIVPVGHPLPGNRVSVVNASGEVLPRGMVGQIVIEGTGIARGYLGGGADGSVIAQAEDGTRTYYTGDAGLIDAQAKLTVYGRADHQVKIRGYRVGLKEIERAVLSYRAHRLFDIADTPQSVSDVECASCGLPAHHPDSDIDETGLCALCRQRDRFEAVTSRYFESPGDFDALLAEKPRTAPFDCMLLYSGGKDSSYVLHRLAERGLNVLAFTFDNGHISAAAFENIRRQTEALGATSVIQSLDDMDELFVESLNSDATVCTGCFRALTAQSTRLAADFGIDLILTGLSRGQIMETKLQKLIEQGVTEVPEIEKRLVAMRRAYHISTDRANALVDTDLSDIDFEAIQFIDYFRYDPSGPDEVRRYLASVDDHWRAPKDTGFCSSNCMINDIGICTHIREKNYHNYAAPLAWDLRLNLLDRESLEREVRAEIDPKRVNLVLDRIGYFQSPMNDAVVVARQTPGGESQLCCYFTARYDISADDLRAHMAQRLPGYMMPAHFIQCDALPLSSHGKIDTAALPDVAHALASEAAFAEPETEAQKAVANAWKRVLGVDRVGLDHAFFSMGGSSLELVELQHVLQDQFQCEVDLLDLFEMNTVRLSADLFEKAGARQPQGFDI